MWRAYKILFLVIILEIIAIYDDHFISNISYCTITSCLNRHLHVGCLYPSYPVGEYCTTENHSVISRRLKYWEKVTLVRYHNSIRQNVAAGHEWKGLTGSLPSAISMPNLTWDQELAYLAQIWADQCPGPYILKDKCRDVERFTVNQVVTRVTSNTTEGLPTIYDIIDSWYNEVKYFDRRNVCSYVDDEDARHFSQMVWADTTKIGCGKIIFKDGRPGIDPQERYIYFIVCNYGPGGNLETEKVYDTNSIYG